jgi:hypothetical protein
MTKVKEHAAAGIDTAGSQENFAKLIRDGMAKWVPVVKRSDTKVD